MQFNNSLDLLKSLNDQDEVVIGEKVYQNQNGIFHNKSVEITSDKEQIQDVFSYKWNKRDTFESKTSLSRMKEWLFERYGDPKEIIESFSKDKISLLDAGCGAGMSALEYWIDFLPTLDYVGVDISDAVTVAKSRFEEHGIPRKIFMQESFDNLPFKEPHFDIIFSEGALQFTDSTENAFNHLCSHLRPDGFFMFYLYRKKGPIREFADDHIRKQIHMKSGDEAWNELGALTELGVKLGELDIEIDIPRDISLLEIPAGKINLQRLFYWHVCKAFYSPDLTFDEMNHINFDYYAPVQAHRHTPEEIKQWCDNNGLEIKQQKIEDAGITCIAQKK